MIIVDMVASLFQGIFLVVGFIIQNITEGLGIAALAARRLLPCKSCA
jgi:zinc transporter ZupT